MKIIAFSSRVEDRDARWKKTVLATCHREAETQEGDGIARAWIADPKEYPGIPMPQ